MHCIWITFDSPNLTEIIKKLAQKYNSPVFKPHCTLIGKTDIALSTMESVVVNLMKKYKPFSVHPEKIGYTDNMWRALYIELKEKLILTKWHKHVCDLLSINHETNYLPHISLMYNSISLREKKKIVDKIQLKAVYKINSIQIINCGENVNDWIPIFELKI